MPRLSAAQAGYMELQGAQKDADCHKVEVKGGVSKELGCCNEFQPESKAVNEFRCGMCEYLKERALADNSLVLIRQKAYA